MNLWNNESIAVLLAIVASFANISLAETPKKYKEQFAIEGTSYKMKCPDLGINNESTPMPYIVWSVNGLPPRSLKYKLLDDGLVIRNVSIEDAIANYTCTALDRQTFLPVKSEKVKLVIRQRGAKSLEKTSSSSSTGNQVKIWVWGILNQPKTLQCRMFSRPSPTFTWINQKTGEEIKNSPDLYKIVQDDSTSNLTIFLHNDTLFGEYTCRGSNIHGESTQNFTLAEGYKPKSPFMYPTYIGKDKITVKVEPQEDHRRGLGSDLTDEILPIKHYFVQFVKADSFKSVDRNDSNGPANNPFKFGGEYRRKWTTLSKTIETRGLNSHITETFGLKNLEENSTYLVRSAVANAAAISDFSSAIRITTDSSPPDSKTEDADNQSKDVKQPGTVVGKGREEYGRSTGDDDVPINETITSVTKNTTNDGNIDGGCENPKFRKTVIITTISTTLIETIDEAGHTRGGNSSLVKKRVEEDTTVDRINLCSLD